MIDRRDFLKSASVAVIALGLPEPSAAFWHGSSAASFSPVFNGGKTQVNFNFPASDSSFPFLNLLKCAPKWTGVSGTFSRFDDLDSNGYPQHGSALVATSGIWAGCPQYTTAERTAIYSILWSGNGTVACQFFSGQTYSITSASKAAQCVLVVANNTSARGRLAVGQAIVVSGATGTGWSILNTTQIITAISPDGTQVTINLNTSAVSGTLGGTISAACTLTSTTGSGRAIHVRSATLQNIGIASTSDTPNNITNIRYYQIDDEVAGEAALVAGQPGWNPLFLNVMRAGNFGRIRYMDWQGAFSGANDTNVSFWSHRKPLGYAFYFGDEIRASLYGGTVTSANSLDYSATISGLSLSDKILAQVFWGTTAVIPTATVTITTGTPGVINWTAHGRSDGEPFQMHATTYPVGGLTQGVTYYVKSPLTNSFNLALTPGGAAIAITAANTGTLSGIRPPTLGLNVAASASNPAINYGSGDCLLPFGGTTPSFPPTANAYATLVYDAQLGAWLSFLNSGIRSGIPPELFYNLSAVLGAHPHICAPYLTLDPPTDYVSSMVQYGRDNFNGAGKPCTWMKPAIETVNEEWNSGAFIGPQYALVKGNLYWNPFTGSTSAGDEWQGMTTSYIGQMVSAVYGADRTKYEVLCGTQSTNGGTTSGYFGNGGRLVASRFVADGVPYTLNSLNAGVTITQTNGYKWATSVTTANYYGPAWDNQLNYPTAAFLYQTTADNTQVTSYLDSTVQVANPNNTLGQVQIRNQGWKNYQRCFSAAGATFSGTISGTTFTLSSTPANTGIPLLGMTLTGASAGTVITAFLGGTPGVSGSTYTVNNSQSASVTGGTFPGAAVEKTCGYEGAWNWNSGAPSTVTTQITAISKASSAVITTSTTAYATMSATAGNPACANIWIKLAGLAVPYDIYNTQVVKVTAVAGNNVTVLLDTSAQGASYSGTGSCTYFGDSGATITSTTMMTNLSYAAKFCTSSPLSPNGTQGYDFGGDFTSTVAGCHGCFDNAIAAGWEYPSTFQLTQQGSGNPWGILAPDGIFSNLAACPQWLAIVAANH